MNRQWLFTTALALVCTVAVVGCSDGDEMQNPASRSIVSGDVDTYEYVVESTPNATVDGLPVTLDYFNFSGSAKLENAPIVKTGIGCEIGAAKPASGAIAVAMRGGCSFQEKYDIARSSGSVGLIITDSKATDSGPGKWGVKHRISVTEIPVFSATDESSVERINQGRSASISFDARVVKS